MRSDDTLRGPQVLFPCRWFGGGGAGGGARSTTVSSIIFLLVPRSDKKGRENTLQYDRAPGRARRLNPTPAWCSRLRPTRRRGRKQLGREPPEPRTLGCHTASNRGRREQLRVSGSTDYQRSCTTPWKKPIPCLSCPPKDLFLGSPLVTAQMP